jgi:hypothetical protein
MIVGGAFFSFLSAKGGATGGDLDPAFPDVPALGGKQPISKIMLNIDGISVFIAIFQNAGDLGMGVASNAADLGLSGVATKALGVNLQSEGYTVFAPTNESLVKALGAEKVAALQSPGQREMAKAFVLGLTVAKRYRIQDLKDIASQSKSASSLSGDVINLKVEEGKVKANSAELLSEYAASNGYILTTNGVASTK